VHTRIEERDRGKDGRRVIGVCGRWERAERAGRENEVRSDRGMEEEERN